MIQRCGFMDSDVLASDYRYYNSEEITTPFRYMITDGVMLGGTALRVVAGSFPLSVSVHPGAAWVRGRWYTLKDDGLGDGLLPVPLEASAQFPRLDRIILRLEFGAKRSIHLAVLKGAEAVSPVAPKLVREVGETGTWDICLATVRVNPSASMIAQSNITDARFTAECGVCDFAPNPIYDPHITQWNTDLGKFRDQWNSTYTALTKQIQSFYADMPAQWDKWLAEQKAKGFLSLTYLATYFHPAVRTSTTAIAGMSSTNVQAALAELFGFASNGKAAFAGVIGSPAAASQTFAQIKTHAQNAKNTLAANLVSKGIAAAGTETMAGLANKAAQIPLGLNKATPIVYVKRTASGNMVAPAKCYKMDICLVGGGGSGNGSKGGRGGAVVNVYGIATTPGQSLYAAIGAGGAGSTSQASNAGGTTSFAGRVAAGGAGGYWAAPTASESAASYLALMTRQQVLDLPLWAGGSGVIPQRAGRFGIAFVKACREELAAGGAFGAGVGYVDITQEAMGYGGDGLGGGGCHHHGGGSWHPSGPGGSGAVYAKYYMDA